TGVSSLMKKNKIEKIVGSAKFVGPNRVEATPNGATPTLTAKHIVIATGSAPVELPFLKFDGKQVISSDHAIALDKIPSSMVVIGGGAIGLEMGSVWARLGAKVTVLEMLPALVAGGGEEMARGLEKVVKKEGLNFYLQEKVHGAVRGDG